MRPLENDWRTMETDYRFCRSSVGVPSAAYESATLTDPEALHPVLLSMGKKLGCYMPPIAGSLLVKYYARALCAVLFAMSRLQLGLRAPASLVRLEFDEHHEPLLVWHGDPDTDIVPAPSDIKARQAWRADIVSAMFREHLEPILRTLSPYAHVSACTLWENVVVYVHHNYKVWLERESDAVRRALLEDDYAFVTKHGGCELFGACASNPLDIAGGCFNNPLQPGETLRIRKTCCLKVHLPNGQNCTNCPSLSEIERKKLLEHKADKRPSA